MVALSGRCACGAIKYSLPELNETKEGCSSGYELSVCHCETCRQWTGGIMLSITPPCKTPSIEGQDSISVYKSSSFGERAFCKKCGSSLYFKVISPGTPHHNDYHFCAGTLTNYKDLQLTREVFVDSKPQSYCLEENLAEGKKRTTMTKAQYDAVMSNGGPST